MGSGSSCYPTRDQRGSVVPEPYDTRQLLSELITVQTAIVLSDDIGDRRDDCKAPQNRRTSIEYTITTSLTVPVPTLSFSGHGGGPRNDQPFTGLENQGGALMDIITAHFKHKVDIVTRDSGLHLMPCIQETSELIIC